MANADCWGEPKPVLLAPKPPAPPALGEPKAGAFDVCENEPKPDEAVADPKAGAEVVFPPPNIEPPDAELFAAFPAPPNIDPPEGAPKGPADEG